MTKGTKISLIAAAVIFVCACIASFFILRPSDKKIVEITQDGKVIYKIDLLDSSDREIRIDAPDGGYNTVKIENHTICVSESDCPDKICVHSGVLEDSLPIVCLPHKLIIKFSET